MKRRFLESVRTRSRGPSNAGFILIIMVVAGAVGSTTAVPVSPDPPQGDGVSLVATWAQGCDIRVTDASSNRDGVEISYTADTTNDTVTLELDLTRDIELAHSETSGFLPLSADKTYVITVSKLKMDVKAEVEIKEESSANVILDESFLTHGPKSSTKDTSEAKVYTALYDNDSLMLWVAMNHRSTSFLLDVDDVFDFDVVVKETLSSSSTPTLDITYTANAAEEKVTVDFVSSAPLTMIHPNLKNSSAQVTEERTYRVVLSNLVSGQEPKLEIDLLRTESEPEREILGKESTKTWGGQMNGSNATIQVVPHDDKTLALWMSFNGRGTTIHLQEN